MRQQADLENPSDHAVQLASGADQPSASNGKVVVVGLGYVGLPLAVALAGKFDTCGFDIDAGRIAELDAGKDRTREIDSERLIASTLILTDRDEAIPASEFIIVTVPTPIDGRNRPDLTIVEAASRTAARVLRRSAGLGRPPIVIYESTVYPGVTEEICGPILEAESGLVCGRDFFLGYSPERINPGDREHTIDKITKVVSGQTPEALERVAELYGAITSGGVFKATSIKAAEAAKVIENAQRDINIAFVNEITRIFSRLDLSVYDVLEAAGTKWNFLNFTPGLVGGHCIGVDPYYLSYRASQLGIDAKVVIAGRGTNDTMAEWVADELHAARGEQPGSVLVLGLTFKENVPDLRNSKVIDVIWRLEQRGHRVTVHDPLADATEAAHEYEVELNQRELAGTYDIVLLAVPHREYLELGAQGLRKHLAEGGTLADLKNALRGGADWTL